MMKTYSRACFASLAGAVVALACSIAASAQGAPPAAIEGIWKNVAPTTSLKPESGAVPFTAEGRKRYDANRKLKARKAFDEYDITTSRCSTPGVPRLMLTPMRFKLWQQLGVVTFGFEWNQAIRQVDLRGAETEQKLVPDMTGTSVGRWEGDALVAVTTDVNERTLLDDLIPHTAALKVTERFRLVGPDTLEDRITIEDAAYFTRPWDAVITYKRQPFAIFPEDVCLDRHDAGQPAVPAAGS